MTMNPFDPLIRIIPRYPERVRTKYWEPTVRITLHKMRFLERPLNWLLYKLGSSHLTFKTNTEYYTIDMQNLRYAVIEISNRWFMEYGKRPQTIILGYDQWKGIIRTDSLNVMLSVPAPYKNQLMGMDVILHPWINGVIPLNEKLS